MFFWLGGGGKTSSSSLFYYPVGMYGSPSVPVGLPASFEARGFGGAEKSVGGIVNWKRFPFFCVERGKGANVEGNIWASSLGSLKCKCYIHT